MGASDKGNETKTKRKPGRVATACAECRRLKLRCDKSVPCEKCVSRGCGSICPDGVLTPGKGNRLILANTEELHERIDHLCSRIRELEAALKTLHESVSDEPHPLLRNDILRTDFLGTTPQQGSSSAASTSSSSKSSAVSRISPTTHPPESLTRKLEEDGAIIDAFGTLTIGQNGESRFLGKTARSEYLIRAPIQLESTTSTSFPRLSSEMTGSPFPDFENRHQNLGEQAHKMLPPLSEAFRLCEIYLEYGKYMYSPVPRSELLDEILAIIYRTESLASFQSHHALSLLFIIFAIASHFDPHKEPYSVEGQEYYQLARTALSLSSPVRDTTLASIQTLIHMAQYLDLSDWESSGSASAWIYIGHAVQLGHSIGLHLNSARWKLPESDVNRRSRVFWQLFVLDTWASFCFGRPPCISKVYIDCVPPQEPGDVTTPGGSVIQISFHSWNYQFTSLMNSVMASGMGPKQPHYSTILDLDRKVRDFPVPLPWHIPEEDETPHLTSDVRIYRWMVLASKESTLLNLHRAYFAQALHDNPADLQRHRYIPSVLAIYRSSWRLILGLRVAWSHVPHLLERVNLPWSQALSAAIVMCLLVTRAPSSHLTPQALEKLDSLMSLFHSASSTCRSAANLMPSIQNLCHKAYEATVPSRSHLSPSYTAHFITPAELDRLSGKTHLFAEHGPVLPSSSTFDDFSTRSRGTSVTLSDTADSSSMNIDGLHPILCQDLKDFGMRNPIPTIASLSDAGTGSPITTPRREPSSPSVQDFYQPPPPPVPPPLHGGYSPEFQRYCESLDTRRSSIAGFVAGFEPPPQLLDATWQCFVEQLGF